MISVSQEPADRLSVRDRRECEDAFALACARLAGGLPVSSRMGAGLIIDAGALSAFAAGCEEHRVELTAWGLETLARIRWAACLRGRASAEHARSFPERYADDHVEKFTGMADEDERLAEYYLRLRLRIWDDDADAPRGVL